MNHGIGLFFFNVECLVLLINDERVFIATLLVPKCAVFMELVGGAVVETRFCGYQV